MAFEKLYQYFSFIITKAGLTVFDVFLPTSLQFSTTSEWWALFKVTLKFWVEIAIHWGTGLFIVYNTLPFAVCIKTKWKNSFNFLSQTQPKLLTWTIRCFRVQAQASVFCFSAGWALLIRKRNVQKREKRKSWWISYTQDCLSDSLLHLQHFICELFHAYWSIYHSFLCVQYLVITG